MGEMRDFGIVKTNQFDWVKNLLVSLDPYTKGIAERKLTTAYKRGLSPDSVLQFLRQLSNISISRTANRATNINSFGVIRKQSQEAEYRRYLAGLRESHRSRFDEMMASPISLNKTSATYDDILRGKKEQSQREYEQLRDYYAGIEAEQSEKRARKAEINELYRKDMLSDFDSRMENLTERYGGDKSKAENKYKKELSQNLPLFFRNSKMTAKQMYNLSKVLSFGKSAFGAGSLIAGTVIATTKAVSRASDSANSRIVGMENLQNLYGRPSRDVLNAGLLAGMSPEQITKVHGQLLTKFGGVKPLMNVAKSIASQSPLARVAVAEQLGLDENMMAFLDILAGTGRIKNTEHRQMSAKRILTEYQKASMLKTGSSALDTIIGWFGDSSVGARFADDIKMKGEDAKDRANESSSLPSQSTTQPSEGVAPAGNQVSFSIGNVNVDADNPAEFIASMQEVASSRGGRSLAIAFDTGVMA